MKHKKFKNFNILLEKISKKDISDGLKDSELSIGVEYEFIFNEDVLIREEDKLALKERNILIRDMNKLYANAKEKFRIYRENILLALIIEKSKVQDELNNALEYAKIQKIGSDEYDNAWIDVNGIRDVFKDLEWVEEDPLNRIYEIYLDIDNVPKKDSWHEDITFLTNLDEYDSYIYWLDSNRGVRIEDDFVNDFNDGLRDVNNFNINDFIEAEELVYPEEGTLDDFPTREFWEDLFDRLDELPFNARNAKYYDYTEGTRNHRMWGVGSDGSLGYTGCEISTPIMNMSDCMNSLPNMFEFINNYGSTQMGCGLHVNMSYKNKSFFDMDFLKLMLFMDEDLIYKVMKLRKISGFANSVLDAIKKEIEDGARYDNYKLRYTMQDIFGSFKDKIIVPYEKNFGINIVKASTHHGDKGRVEFRYLGEDYSNKYKFVVSQIGRYAHLMKLGFDYNYKKNEYITKLTRLYNRLVDDSGIKPEAVSNNTIKLIDKKGIHLKSGIRKVKGKNILASIYYYKGQVYALRGKNLLHVYQKGDPEIRDLYIDDIFGINKIMIRKVRKKGKHIKQGWYDYYIYNNNLYGFIDGKLELFRKKGMYRTQKTKSGVKINDTI